jgi:AcrR family transcriptional regulator
MTRQNARRPSQRSGWRQFAPLEMSPVQTATLDAFAEHGYDGTSVRDIASRAGISIGGLYYHFESKQDALVGLLQGFMEDVYGRACLAAAEAGPEPAARLGALVECICLYMAHRRKIASIGAEMRSLEQPNLRRYVAIRDALEDLFHAAVRDGMASGAFRAADAAQASKAIITMCRGIAAWYRPDGPLSPAEIAVLYRRYAFGIVEASRS